MPCPSCTRLLPTRVLADPVTLIVVGVCPEHGTAELSRVRLHEAPAYAPAYPEERSSGPAYRPGQHCGRRLDGTSWCALPHGHREPHTA